MLFFDTCSLLDLQEKAFKAEEKFLISNITLVELETIKESRTKDEDIKYQARHLLHLLEKYSDKYIMFPYNVSLDNAILQWGYILNNDSRIIASANFLKSEYPDLIFISSDLACRMLAQSIGLKIGFIEIENKDYTGYTKIQMDDDELANFYSVVMNNKENPYELLENEYLLITDKSNKVIDKYKWHNNEYVKVPFYKIQSKMFGKIVGKDEYQQIALDSLHTNQFTMLRGPAGSGKDYLGLAYTFYLLEQGIIDRIFIFVNPVATRGAAKLGYYPGDKNSKILDSQIGNFLIGKLGDIELVYQMIDRGQLILMPMSDVRGVDLSGSHSLLYITEGQNMTIDMMKLALQRVGEDTKVIINGDTESQVDLREYEGNNNGLKRASEIFKNNPFYGEVCLKTIYRSKVARTAEEM